MTAASIGMHMRCTCCGGTEVRASPVLWRELIDAWDLNEAEAAVINRQQGLVCSGCGTNLRGMTLAFAIMSLYEYRGYFADFVRSAPATRLSVLEINEAGMLAQFLQRLPKHVIVRYPESDMMQLRFPDTAFDLVVHSDTLEHVPDPVAGLRECHRVLKQGGACAFTVPLVVGRLSRSREGLPPSYHGSPDNPADNLVHTEFGADAWTHALMAGFGECRILTLEHPTSHALVAIR